MAEATRHDDGRKPLTAGMGLPEYSIQFQGFNRKLRLAENRRSTATEKSKTPPAISAVVLDDVDGDVLDSSPNRVPGSPVLPSPQRISIPRTPVSGRSLLEKRSLLDAVTPHTPACSTNLTSVEVLLRGTMRTAASPWFRDGEAWFPAELLNLYRAPAPSADHQHFECEIQEEEVSEQGQVWVQVRVPALLEQAIIWVKIESVRRVKNGCNVQPSQVGQDVEVSQMEDGRCIWYRGRLLASAPDHTAGPAPERELLKTI